MTQETTPANYRAVLIGIDDYCQKPLSGCVNDIDSIERVLLDRLRIPPARITRLTAPRDGTSSATRLPCLTPTLEELRGCLRRLYEEVRKEDAVFIYYSGHGSQVIPDWSGHRVAREALVPVDCGTGETRRLLYDFELNHFFTRIAERAGDLTVVLDCCHSAGATRDFEGATDRYLEIPEVQRLAPPEIGEPPERDAAGLAPEGSGDHMLTAACRSNETAREVEVRDGTTGSTRRQGAFTYSLLQLLNAADRPLQELRWADVWPLLLDSVGKISPAQNPLLVGRWERRLFGGSWTPRDTGYVVQRDGERLSIRGGTLTGLTEGAEVALYGSDPDLFPPLDSQEDRASRLGLARVVKAERSSCIAVTVNGLGELPTAVRGRLVKPGEPDRLVVSLEPFDQELADRFVSWNLRAVKAGNPEAEARLRRVDGCFLLGDAVYDDPRDPERPPLAEIPDGRLDLLEAALRHYARYNLVLRFPRRCLDLPNALQISLLDCRNLKPSEKQLHELQDPDLPELGLGKEGVYEIREGNGFVIRIGNQFSRPLHVSVFNCAGSGRVEHLGEAEIPEDSRHVFWLEGILGSSLYPEVGLAAPSAVERLVIVGTTRPDQDFRHLAVPESFAEILGLFREGGEKNMTGPKAAPSPPAEQWTAEMIPLRIVR